VRHDRVVAPARRGLIQPTQRAVNVVGLAVLAAGLASCAVVLAVAPSAPAVHAPWLAVTAVVAIIGSHVWLKRFFSNGGSVEAVSFDEVIFVPLLLVVPPAWMVLAVLTAVVVGSAAMRRPWVKAAFNVGQLLVATAFGLLTFHALAGPATGQLQGRQVLAAVLATLMVAFVSRSGVVTMISWVTRGSWRQSMRLPVDHLVAWLGAAILGASGTATSLIAPSWGFVLAISMVVFVHRAYSSQVQQVTARKSAERLELAVAELRGSRDRAEIERSLVAAVHDLLGAREVATPAAPYAAEPPALSAPLGATHQLVAQPRRGAAAWTEHDRDTLRTLAGVADDALRSADLFSRLQTITDAQNEAVVAFDAEGRITFANPAARDMLGRRSTRQIEGLPVNDVCHLVARSESIDLTVLLHEGVNVEDDDALLRTRGGQQVEVAYSFAPLVASDVSEGAVLVLRDVTERRALQEALSHRALHDELTGLPNRRLFLDRLDHALDRSLSSRSRHGVLFIDLDRFKLVNDSFGHLLGDQLLIQLSERLLRRASVGDTVARLSGDEFILLVEDRSDISLIADLAHQLVDDLRRPYLVDGHTILLTVSIGVTSTSPGQTRDEVMVAADAATYAAKADGRNCVRIATRDLIEASRSRLELEGRLRQAIDAEDLRLWYQPIVDTRTRELHGVEALVRWQEADGIVVMPDDFIPIAEDSGLIVMLGRWVLEEACRAACRWNHQYPHRAPLQMSVNLSALQLAQPNLAEEVSEVLARNGLPPSQLCIEITETAVFANLDANVRALTALRDIGVKVAVDDFGTGYSSLAYLRKLPVDTVKLDASFIAGLGNDMVDTQIVASVLRLCKALGRRTVAEGVETETQWQALKRMGCPAMQGYLVARPLTAQAFEHYWNREHGSEGLRLVSSGPR
jgi:diguanylate cyclase (GGDEF)-like protein/PAS domain S-box-containing protein